MVEDVNCLVLKVGLRGWGKEAGACVCVVDDDASFDKSQ
jgi:hypothetical protein